MLHEVEPMFYAVVVNGVVVSPRFPSPTLAEQWRQTSPYAQSTLFEIAPVNEQGKRLLLG